MEPETSSLPAGKLKQLRCETRFQLLRKFKKSKVCVIFTVSCEATCEDVDGSLAYNDSIAEDS